MKRLVKSTDSRDESSQFGSDLIGRHFLGGHYSRSLPETNFRPYSAKIYNDNMGGVDNYDIFLHRYTLRYIPLKHKLAWLLKPVLSVIDYQLLNSFLLRKEIRPI